MKNFLSEIKKIFYIYISNTLEHSVRVSRSVSYIYILRKIKDKKAYGGYLGIQRR